LPVLRCAVSVLQPRLPVLPCAMSVFQPRLPVLRCTASVLQTRMRVLQCAVSLLQQRVRVVQTRVRVLLTPIRVFSQVTRAHCCAHVGPSQTHLLTPASGPCPLWWVFFHAAIASRYFFSCPFRVC